MGETPPDPGDAAVLGMAFDEDRVLITLDKDFSELAIIYGGMPVGWLVQVQSWPSGEGST